MQGPYFIISEVRIFEHSQNIKTSMVVKVLFFYNF